MKAKRTAKGTRDMIWEHSSAVDGVQFGLILPNTRANAMLARGRVMQFARTARFAADVLDDIAIAVGEALANAVEHGFRSNGTIDVCAGLTAEGIEVAVTDDGPGFAMPPGRQTPSNDQPRGFGLFLMRSVTDEIEFRSDGRSVCFLKKLAC
jgi:anti-sigma regulatory factor (Ser/Thr protein kinase)